ncbi:MAG: hypothetical protein EPO20_05370 [Betaproteobacteria bacterium]|nr:MAG: hypothetical protein EPO20_05370 [Betaproteobacteria bacterium]
MNKLRPPAFHDIARIIGRDVDETEARLYSYYTNPFGAFFSYHRAQALCRFAFGRMLPLRQVLEGCGRERTQQGKNCNSEVLRLLWERSAHRSVRTYELAPKFLTIRKDLNIRVAPPFYFVEGDNAYVFWLQPRKEYAFNVGQLGLLASMVKVTFLVDDFRDVGFELCDMSAPLGKERDPNTYHLESFNILSEAGIREKLQLFALAYDRCVARGVERSKRTPKQQPPAGPDLFTE